MPTYGDDKIKDMIESLLPSTHRKGAREDRALAHRKERRAAKRNPEDSQITDRRRRIDITYIKWDRRSADNVAAFMRWAVGASAHLEDPEARFNYIKSLLPDNTIGRHALSHIDHLDEFDWHEYTEWGPINRTKADLAAIREARDRREEERYLELVQNLLDILAEPGGHKALNGAIKRSHHRSHYRRYGGIRFDPVTERFVCDLCERPRLLGGAHDVEAFIADIYGRHQHSEWSGAVEAFLKRRKVA